MPDDANVPELPPPAPVVPPDVDKNLTSGTTTILSWNDVDGADSFEVTILPINAIRTTTASQLDMRFLDSGRSYEFEIRARNAAGLSEPALVGPIRVEPPTPSGSWLVISAALFVGFVILGVVYLLMARESDGQTADFHRYRGVASFVVAAILGIVVLLGGRFGVFRPILGLDGRISTSKTQVAIWTVFVAWALVFLAMRAVLDEGDFNPFEAFPIGGPDTDAGAASGNGQSPSDGQVQTWDEYLILLGGPFVSLVAAKGIVSTKVRDETIQKGVEDPGAAELRQVIGSDGGGVDLVDTQYLVFNLVALFYVALAFLRDNQLPEVPALLLALTSTGAATYVLNKAVQQNAPAVRDLVPSVAVAGQRIQIEGRNLLPRGIDHPPSVKIGGRPATVLADSSTDTRIEVLVPPKLPPGSHAVELSTTTRLKTKSLPLTVEEDQAVILGIEPAAGVPKSGGPITVSGYRFVGALRGDTTTTHVRIDGAITPASISRTTHDLQTIDVDLPVTAADSTKLSVLPPLGKESDEEDVPRAD